jgi:hypothetical protein
MHRWLNLNQPGLVFVKVIGLFMVLIPAVLYAIGLLWDETETIGHLLRVMIQGSFWVGVVLLIVFLALILVEQIQDYRLHEQYKKQQNQKVLLANGFYECQYCGNQRVRENDRVCEICGKELIKVRRSPDISRNSR